MKKTARRYDIVKYYDETQATEAEEEDEHENPNYHWHKASHPNTMKLYLKGLDEFCLLKNFLLSSRPD